MRYARGNRREDVRRRGSRAARASAAGRRCGRGEGRFNLIGIRVRVRVRAAAAFAKGRFRTGRHLASARGLSRTRGRSHDGFGCDGRCGSRCCLVRRFGRADRAPVLDVLDHGHALKLVPKVRSLGRVPDDLGLDEKFENGHKGRLHDGLLRIARLLRVLEVVKDLDDVGVVNVEREDPDVFRREARDDEGADFRINRLRKGRELGIEDAGKARPRPDGLRDEHRVLPRPIDRVVEDAGHEEGNPGPDGRCDLLEIVDEALEKAEHLVGARVLREHFAELADLLVDRERAGEHEALGARGHLEEAGGHFGEAFVDAIRGTKRFDARNLRVG